VELGPARAVPSSFGGLRRACCAVTTFREWQMSVTERLDRMQRRHPVLGFPLAVLYKFVDDQGSYLAALITYYGFLSLFPLLLLLTSVLGFVLAGDAHLQQRVLNSTLSQFPVIGSQLGDPKGCGAAAPGS